MSMLKLSKDDLNADRVLEPGWYPFECISYETSASKTDASTNHTWKFKGLQLEGFNDPKGIKLIYLVNEKFLNPMKTLLIGAGLLSKDNLEGVEFDPQHVVGCKMLVFVKPEKYQDKMQNRIKEFKPLS